MLIIIESFITVLCLKCYKVHWWCSLYKRWHSSLYIQSMLKFHQSHTCPFCRWPNIALTTSLCFWVIWTSIKAALKPIGNIKHLSVTACLIPGVVGGWIAAVMEGIWFQDCCIIAAKVTVCVDYTICWEKYENIKLNLAYMWSKQNPPQIRYTDF